MTTSGHLTNARVTAVEESRTGMSGVRARFFSGGASDGDGQAAVYFANRQANPPLPSSDYKNLLVSGARYWELPPEYIRELEEVETSG